MVGVHLQDAADTFLLTLGRVVNVGTAFQRAGVDTEERQLSDVGVCHDLECKSRERTLVVCRTLCLLVQSGDDSLDGGNVQRRRHIVYNGIQHQLNTLVFIGGTAENGNHLVGDGHLADGGLDLLCGEFFTFQILHHEIFVALRNGFQHLLPVFLCEVHHVFRDLLLFDDGAEIVFVDLRLHLDEVDNAPERALHADGELHGHRICLQSVLDHVQNMVEVGTHDIHLVDEDHSGNAVLFCLSPDRLGLGFYAAFGAEYGDGTVQYTQGSLYLYGKVHVTRCIDNVDSSVFPLSGRSSRSDGDASFLLLLHPVHDSRTFVRLTHFMSLTGIEQNTLGRSRFTGVDVRHDADIASVFQRKFSRHVFLLSCPVPDGLLT